MPWQDNLYKFLQFYVKRKSRGKQQDVLEKHSSRVRHRSHCNTSVTWSDRVWRLCSGVSRQAQPEAAEESEHQCELVPVLSRDVRHPAVHHRAGEHPAALRLQGEQMHNNLNTLFISFISYFQVSVCASVRVDVLHDSRASSSDSVSVLIRAERFLVSC